MHAKAGGLASLLALAVATWSCGPASSGTSSALDGEWLVDFGSERGVLSLRRGIVYAWCYGPELEIGRYALEGDHLELRVQFDPSRSPLDFSGTVERGPHTDGFALRLAGSLRLRPLAFTRFAGDCAAIGAEDRELAGQP